MYYRSVSRLTDDVDPLGSANDDVVVPNSRPNTNLRPSIVRRTAQLFCARDLGLQLL